MNTEMRVKSLGGRWLEESVVETSGATRGGAGGGFAGLYKPYPQTTPASSRSLFPSERRTGPLPINFKCSVIYPPFVIASRVRERVVVAEQGDEVETGCKIDTKTSLVSHGKLPHGNFFVPFISSDIQRRSSFHCIGTAYLRPSQSSKWLPCLKCYNNLFVSRKKNVFLENG